MFFDADAASKKTSYELTVILSGRNLGEGTQNVKETQIIKKKSVTPQCKKYIFFHQGQKDGIWPLHRREVDLHNVNFRNVNVLDFNVRVLVRSNV